MHGVSIAKRWGQSRWRGKPIFTIFEKQDSGALGKVTGDKWSAGFKLERGEGLDRAKQTSSHRGFLFFLTPSFL